MQAVNATPWFKELLTAHQPPCISLYVPVQRTDDPNAVNQKLFREALDDVRRRAGEGMEQLYGKDHMRRAMLRLKDAMKDDTLLDGDREALAFFCSADHAHVIEIREPGVRADTTIAETFHIKPLIRALQRSQRYRVLLIAIQNIRMFEGDHTSIREIAPLHRAVPRSAEDPIATQTQGTDTTPQGTGNTTPITTQPSYAPGSVGADRFYRLVDQAVWEYYSRLDPIPTLVVADVKTLSGFLEAAKYPTLLEDGIQLNPAAATPDRIREEAWRLLQPHLEQQVNLLKDAYQAAKARQLGSDEVPRVAEAAATGRVGTLLVDADAKIPGVFHPDTGMIEPAPPTVPQAAAEDILDDLAETVLKMDGQVYVLPHDQMPTDHGVAAVYRY